jgi:hypothetical protein
MTKGITVFHKKYDQHNKRHRTGYDNSLGPTLQKKGTVTVSSVPVPKDCSSRIQCAVMHSKQCVLEYAHCSLRTHSDAK